MKLLASLLGCAVADYACCPYDEFGVVNPGCPLTEKTPWAMSQDNSAADPAGVEVHLCKAWEANIDGTMEGNEDLDNWGGCGFQRHFSWANTNVIHGASVTNAIQTTAHCQMGMMSCPNAGTTTTLYKRLKAGTAIFHLTGSGSASASPFTAQNTNDVFGEVTLGGVCKLFIPVQQAHIDSVSVAGVHMNGKKSGAFSVFDAQVCSDNTCTSTTDGTTSQAKGTAYCFSVVNVAEFMRNNMPGSNFQVMNANVAGRDDGGHAPITLPGENGQDFTVDFGSSIEPSQGVGQGLTTMVEAGASFDVVVHFKSAYCIRHWSIVDMQTDPDWNSGPLDYPLADAASIPQHAHTDVADKRLNAMVGICGCCDASNVRHDDLAAGLAPSTKGCTACTGASGCTDFDSYVGMVPAGMKWPNVGAWAAFYSFITCADNTFLVYDTMTSAIDVTTGAVTKTRADRGLVHSMFYNDVRHDWSNANGGDGKLIIRGNFRQVGDKVKNCGPGTVPTTDSSRCTWNWNFIHGTDAESWFERDTPLNFNVWKSGLAVDRNVEANSLSGAIGNIIEPHIFTLNFRDSNTGIANFAGTAVLSVDASKYFAVAAGTSSGTAGYEYTVTMNCLQSSLDGTGTKILTDPAVAADIGDTTSTNVRDLFPDCYMGDEIHFSLAIAPGNTATDNQRISSWFSSVTANW